MGVARDSLDRTISVPSDKVDRRPSTTYKDNPIVQQTIDEALTNKERAAVMILRQQAFQTGRQICQMMLDLIGGEATYARADFKRQLPDMNIRLPAYRCSIENTAGPRPAVTGLH